MNNFRMMFEAATFHNQISIQTAGEKTLYQMINIGIQLENQNLQFNFKKLFIPIDNNTLFKQYNITTQSVQYSENLINEILTFPSKTFFNCQISAENLYFALNEQFKNQYKLTKNIPIYILKYDFENDIKFCFNFIRSFKIKFDNDFIHAQKALLSFKNSQGLLLPNTNCLFLLLNSKSYTVDTICHELYHCLQIICNIPINSLPITQNTLINIPALNLTIQDLKHYLSNKELQTYIEIDFLNQCKNIYENYYKEKIPYKNFVYNVLHEIKQNPINIISNTFSSYLKYKRNIINRDLTPIIIIAACCILPDKQYLKTILEIIQKNFN